MVRVEKSGGGRSINHPVIATLILGFAAFFLLAGYECARGASVSLYLETYGAHLLPVVLVLGPIGTLVLLYGYGMFAFQGLHLFLGGGGHSFQRRSSEFLIQQWPGFGVLAGPDQ